jgi:hypothetical protein
VIQIKNPLFLIASSKYDQIFLIIYRIRDKKRIAALGPDDQRRVGGPVSPTGANHDHQQRKPRAGCEMAI